MSGVHSVAAGDAATVDAAEEILRAGGNAFDAAVGAAFAAMVAEPVLTSPGGGGHMLACPHDQPPILFDFFVDMPSRQYSEDSAGFFPIEIDFGTARQRFHVGKASSGVPGNVAGLLHAHSRLGRMTRAGVMEPSIRLASQGVRPSATQKNLFEILDPIIQLSPSSPLACFSRSRKADLLVQSELADLFDAIAREGADLFYRGEVAQKIVEWSAYGGLVAPRDLEGYRVIERVPLEQPFHGASVLLNPPPAQSGILMQFTLSVLKLVMDTGTFWEGLLVALEATTRARRKYCVPGARPLPDSISHPELVARCLQETLEAFRWNGEDVFPGSGSTTHISVLDSQGNAASVTTTNGEGCGFFISGLGFMLNNMLGEEDLNPEGFYRYPPGSRLSSMMAPTVILHKGSPWLVTGSAGSNRIRSAVIQLLLHVLTEDVDLEEATRLPRIHLEEGVLHVEPGVPGDFLEWASHRVNLKTWPHLSPFFGGANSVMPGHAAGDLRRGGIGRRFRTSGQPD